MDKAVESPAAKQVAPSPSSFLKRQNRIPEKIKVFQAAKRTGLYTYQAGRYDRYVNLGIGLVSLFTLANVAQGIHKMAYGYGKKEGF